MTIEEKVQAVLIADSTVTAIVPQTKIKTPGDWQNLARPYIVHFPVALSTTYTHEGREDLQIWDAYQVSCFADSYSQARALSAVVARSLSGNHGGAQLFFDRFSYFKEEETKIHQVAVDFRIGEALATV